MRKIGSRTRIPSPLAHESLWEMAKAVRAGAFSAAIDALHYCTEGGLRLPDWAIEALLSVNPASLEGDTRRGHRMDVIHRIRFETVLEVREAREARREERQGSKDGLVPSLRKQLEQAGFASEEAKLRAEKELARFGERLVTGDQFELAAELLRGTAAWGHNAAVKASHGQVERALSEDGIHTRYYLPSDNALRVLGWDDLANVTGTVDARLGHLFVKSGA